MQGGRAMNIIEELKIARLYSEGREPNNEPKSQTKEDFSKLSELCKKIFQRTEVVLYKVEELQNEIRLDMTDKEQDFINVLIKLYDKIYEMIRILNTEDTNEKDANSKLTTALSNVLSKLESEMKKIGILTEIPLNQKFNPHFHEAVETRKMDLEREIIVDVIRVGFFYNGKIIRKSSVVVSV